MVLEVPRGVVAAAPAPPAVGARVTVAHDYFTQHGGAERVAAAIIEALQPDRVVTSVLARSSTYPLPVEVETTPLQRLGFLRRDPRSALPVLAPVWSRIPPVREGVLICSSSGWSHGLRAAPGVVKIVYCHNPARWLYQAEDFFLGRSSLSQFAVALMRPFLAAWDRSAAASADLYICNSRAVAERVRQRYGIEAQVIPPPVSFSATGPLEPVPGLSGPFYLSVGRGRGYKNVDVLVESFRRMPQEQLVIVGRRPPTTGPADPNIRYLDRVPEAGLRWLYANARALISVAHEDFGLTPLEANALGTPSLVLRAGGFLDSTVEDVSGRFIEDESVEAIVTAVRAFPSSWRRDLIREHARQFSTPVFMERLRDAVATVAEPAVGHRAGAVGRPSR